jgi:hypothetical protein
MRKLLISALLGLVILPMPSYAQNISVNGVARSVSLFLMLAKHCPKANVVIAARYGMAFNDVGLKSFGKAAFNRELAKERPRREAEVRNTGAAKWCAHHIDRAERMGVKNIRSRR